ncbi:MAG: glycosyltransferase [Candidatus Margulisiibacteriota bacterium]
MANETNSPLLSIIILGENDGSFPPDALQSAEQADKALAEIVLAPHGAAGRAAALNTAIAAVNGKYLLILDSGNFIRPGYLEKALPLLASDPNVAVVYSDSEAFGARNETVKAWDFTPLRLLHADFIPRCALFRRAAWQAAGGYDESLPDWEDWDLWLKICGQGGRFAYLPEPFCLSRVRPGAAHSWRPDAEKDGDLLGCFYRKHLPLLRTALADGIKRSAEAAVLQQRLDKSKAPSWPHKLARRLKSLARALFFFRARPPQQKTPPAAFGYDAWIRRRLSARTVERLRSQARAFPYRPLISVIMPVCDIAPGILRLSLGSVLGQLYENWQLCVADASTRPDVAQVLQELTAADRRIKLVKTAAGSGIADNTNAALALADGEFVAFLDHDDELTADALLVVVARLQTDRDADLLYSDEDKIGVDGEYCHPFFKPDWSPDLLLGINYICHLCVLRKSLLDRTGPLRREYDGCQDYDLLLRVTELTGKIVHLPAVLYHWRMSPSSCAGSADAKPDVFTRTRAVLEDALRRRRLNARPQASGNIWLHHVRYALPNHPLVSIIIPTRDRPDLIEKCVASILAKTDYAPYEMIIINNGSGRPTAPDSPANRVRVIDLPGQFNYSAINNFAAGQAQGEVLVLLNDDTEVLEPAWLTALVEQALRPEVGAVGGKLLYPDGTIQHAGVIESPYGHLHAFARQPENKNEFSLANAIRDCGAVTGACLAIRREAWERVGGLDENYRVILSDVDLCHKLRQAGLLIVYTPLARLYHLESASRGTAWYPEDAAVFQAKWRKGLPLDDPYYNPNLSLAPDRTFLWRGY